MSDRNAFVTSDDGRRVERPLGPSGVSHGIVWLVVLHASAFYVAAPVLSRDPRDTMWYMVAALVLLVGTYTAMMTPLSRALAGVLTTLRHQLALVPTEGYRDAATFTAEVDGRSGGLVRDVVLDRHRTSRGPDAFLVFVVLEREVVMIVYDDVTVALETANTIRATLRLAPLSGAGEEPPQSKVSLAAFLFCLVGPTVVVLVSIALFFTGPIAADMTPRIATWDGAGVVILALFYAIGRYGARRVRSAEVGHLSKRFGVALE